MCNIPLFSNVKSIIVNLLKLIFVKLWRTGIHAGSKKAAERANSFDQEAPGSHIVFSGDWSDPGACYARCWLAYEQCAPPGYWRATGYELRGERFAYHQRG